MHPPQWRHLPYEEVIGAREVEPHGTAWRSTHVISTVVCCFEALVLDRDYATHNAAFTNLRNLMVPASDVLMYCEDKLSRAEVTELSSMNVGHDQQSRLSLVGVAVSQ
jgi:hypothetical protein